MVHENMTLEINWKRMNFQVEPSGKNKGASSMNQL